MKKLFFIISFLFLFGISNVDAKTTFKIGNTNVGTFNYISVPAGWTYFDWQDDKVYSIDTFPDYFMITICTDASPIVSWVNNRYNSQGGTDQLSLESVTIFNTNAQCKFPDSTYSGAHIVYVIGKQLPERGTSTINWLINSGVTFYNNATASYSLLDIVFSQDPISYDLNTNTLITQNQDIINQNQTIINQNTQTNEKLDNIEDSITSEESPDKLDNLSDSAGWLPAGPVDSILNLPLTMFQNLSNNIGSSCTPLVLTLPYVNKDITLPCLNSIYEQIEGLSVWINSIGTIASAFILYSYLLKLYKWVDDTLTFRENNTIDNWGGI